LTSGIYLSNLDTSHIKARVSIWDIVGCKERNKDKSNKRGVRIKIFYESIEMRKGCSVVAQLKP
jgi:hypothetical protein